MDRGRPGPLATLEKALKQALAVPTQVASRHR
jgi:hypothetical protein